MGNELDNDREIARDGRKSSIADEPGVEVSLRDQIPERLMEKLKKKDMGQKIANLWSTGNINRANWLKRQESFLREYDEFLDPIYEAPEDWMSTLHLPTVLTQIKTFHGRMVAALMGSDPSFTVRPRQAANSKRAPLIQELMRYTTKDWANNNIGIEEELEGWIWDWVASGVGIVKARWDRQFTRFEDIEDTFEAVPDIQVDPNTGNAISTQKIERGERITDRLIKTFEGPCIERVMPEDLLIIGGEGDPQAADAVIQQDWLTASELHILVDQGIFNREAVEETIKGGETPRHEDETTNIKNQRKERAGENTEPMNVETSRYKIYEAYIKVDLDDDGIDSDVIVWTDAKSKKILRATYLWRVMRTGKRPFFKIDFHKRQGQTYGIGLVEMLFPLSKEIDAIHNMRMDSGLLTTIPWGFYKATSSMNKEKLPISPGALIPLDNPATDVAFPEFGNRTSFMLQEENLLGTTIERLTSINDLTLGTISGQGATRTATGVRALAGETNANLDIFLRRMNRGWKQILIYLFQMLQQKLPDGFQFRITGDDGNSYWQQIESREELQGMYDFELDANSANSNPQIRLSVANQIYQLTQNPLDFQLGIFTPMERYEAIRNLLMALGVKDVGRFLRKPDQPQRIFTPIELANRTLQGIDETLTPEQDLQGFIDFVAATIGDDKLLGQYSEQQVMALVRKSRQAQDMLAAMQQAAAQARNVQQISNNSQLTTGGGQVAPAQNVIGQGGF